MGELDDSFLLVVLCVIVLASVVALVCRKIVARIRSDERTRHIAELGKLRHEVTSLRTQVRMLEGKKASKHSVRKFTQ